LKLGKGPVLSIFRVLLARSALLKQLVLRDVQDAYMGSMLSRWWALLHPLLIVGLYLLVFGFVFQQRLGPNAPSAGDFAIYMLPGLCVWLTISAALSRSASSLVAASNLVKQVVFPIELLPTKSVIASFIPALVGILVVIGYALFRLGTISPLLPLVIPILLLQGIMLIGLGLLLSALTVFVRDVRDIVQMFTSAGIFLTPILFAPGVVPAWFESIMFYNPFSYVVWCLQDVFYHQAITRPDAWIALLASSLIALWVGETFFRRVRAHFGDAL
jgi:lipopolysaccharide transport system permease protein